MIEPKIGEIFHHEGVKLKCVQETDNDISACSKCAFYECSVDICKLFACIDKERHDNANVIFVQVNECGEI